MTSHQDMPPGLAEAIKRETAGERVRWTGQPAPGQTLRSSLLIWLFAIPWTAFALFWTASVLGLIGTAKGAAKAGGLNWFFAAFGIPFIVVGLFMLAAPFGLARTARNTVHLITDRRVVTIIANRVRTTVTTVFPADVVTVERTERPDGAGSLKLVLGSYRDSDGDKQSTTAEISNVPDVRRAEQLILAMRAEKRVS